MQHAHAQEYLARLQAIRQQNYQERKRIQQRMNLHRDKGQMVLKDAPQPQLDPEQRKRKIAALKVRRQEGGRGRRGREGVYVLCYLRLRQTSRQRP